MIRALLVCLLGLSTVLVPASAAQEAHTPAMVTFEIADTVSDEDIGLIQESVWFAGEYFQRTYEIELTSPVRVRIGMEENPPTVAYAGGSTIFLTPDHPVWHQSSPLQRVKIVVHEFFHLVQEQLTGMPFNPSPVWLIEGSAEYVAFEAVASLGLIDMNVAHDKWVLDTLYSPVVSVPLQEMEAPAPEVGCCLYSLVPLAVQHLVSESEVSALTDYFDYVGIQTWENAFAMAFGMSVDAFYGSFADWRSQLAPVGYDLTMFQNPGYRSPGTGDFFLETVPEGLVSTDQVLVAGWTAPGVTCSLQSSAGESAQLPIYGAFADATGFVFWLWTPPDSLPSSDIVMQVSCGGAPVVWEMNLG